MINLETKTGKAFKALVLDGQTLTASEAKKRFELKPMITGDDLVKLGMHPGRQFTEILTSVDDLMLEGKLKSKDEALEYVLHHFVK